MVSLEDQTTILDMLCGLLSPIGDHRARHIVSSKGKRKKKRKRGHECTDKDEVSVSSKREVLKDALPAHPIIQRHVTIGFNATTKNLEYLAKRSTVTRGCRHGSWEDTATDSSVVTLDRSETDTYMPVAAVFVAHSDHHAMLYAHIPLLAKMISSAFAIIPSMRLVVLSKGAEQRLGSALAIPRVGVIGLSGDAPESAALMEFVRQRVPEIEVPWLDEVAAGIFLPVKIDETEISAPTEQKRMDKISRLIALADQ